MNSSSPSMHALKRSASPSDRTSAATQLTAAAAPEAAAVEGGTSGSPAATITIAPRCGTQRGSGAARLHVISSLATEMRRGTDWPRTRTSASVGRSTRVTSASSLSTVAHAHCAVSYTHLTLPTTPYV